MKARIAYVMTIGFISLLPSTALFGQVNRSNIGGMYDLEGVGGPLTLTQNGSAVSGVYGKGQWILTGTLEGNKVTGTYQIQSGEIYGEFEWTFKEDGSFEGWWENVQPDTQTGGWNGTPRKYSFTLHFLRAADGQELETLSASEVHELYVEARCEDASSQCFASNDWAERGGSLSWGEGNTRSITFSRIDATTLRSEVFTVLPSSSSETDNAREDDTIDL